MIVEVVVLDFVDVAEGITSEPENSLFLLYNKTVTRSVTYRYVFFNDWICYLSIFFSIKRY